MVRLTGYQEAVPTNNWHESLVRKSTAHNDNKQLQERDGTKRGEAVVLEKGMVEYTGGEERKGFGSPGKLAGAISRPFPRGSTP